MAKLTISLSRAHKITERVKTRMGELYNEALQLGSMQNVGGVTGEAQVNKLAEQGARALERLALADKFSQAHAALRARIGTENEARGITAMLATQQHLNRKVSNLKALIAQGKGVGITPSELGSYKPLSESNRFGVTTVSVVILAAEHIAQLEQELAQVQRDAFALSDRIAEANATRFELELADDIAAEVSGV